ncbi:MAG: protein-glutamate O-methyltransferase CheR [Bacteriovoracaceae bacterium]|nr:protein-glutamate O-methyltransferase CheR [Bacteriovoracaceae bacterium]
MQDNEILKFFANYIKSELGIVYAEHNYFQLQNRLEEISKLIGARNLQELYANCQQGMCGQFKQMLLDQATNNETSFFRDPKVFAAIESIFLKAASEDEFHTQQLRIWSAASSTGQEAISLSILLNEYKERLNSKIQFSIIGTDISERALAKAKEARYSRLEVDRGLSPERLYKHFIKGGADQWIAKPELIKNIEFKKLNLKEPFPFSEKFHLILCRNVLIYQSVEGKTEILKKLTDLLAPGGFLVLGSGESLFGLSTDYEQHFIDGAVIYRIKEAGTKAA